MIRRYRRWRVADADPIAEYAVRMGVTVLGDQEARRKLSRRLLPGPGGGCGCLPTVDAVWVADNEGVLCSPEEVLHEIVHAVLWLPSRPVQRGFGHDEILLLMPYERQVAKALGLSESDLESVLTYQEHTGVFIGDHLGSLGCFHEYEASQEWLSGLAFARQLQLLDEDNEPTWLRPDWFKASRREKAFLRTGSPRLWHGMPPQAAE